MTTSRQALAAALVMAGSLLVAPVAAYADPAPPEGVVVGAGAPDAVPGRYIVSTGAAAAFAATLTPVQARRLAARPGVRTVEQDRLVQVTGRTSTTQRKPVWGLDRIDQRDRRRSNTYTAASDGAAVHAYVIDTGISIKHRQFGGRASYGWDFIDRDASAHDCAGHGTHVAGVLGGSTYGVAKKVRLVSVRVLDCRGVGYVSDIIAGVDWVTRNAKRPAVVNMSLGTAARSPGLTAAINRSVGSGITYVVAAGNDNRAAAGFSPAGLPAVLAVAATDSADKRASYSNHGSAVDIFAPGSGITSAFVGSRTATRVMSGTSMATPHVAGAVALILDAHPGWTPAKVRATLFAQATHRRVTARKGAPDRLLYVPPPPRKATAKRR